MTSNQRRFTDSPLGIHIQGVVVLVVMIVTLFSGFVSSETAIWADRQWQVPDPGQVSDAQTDTLSLGSAYDMVARSNNLLKSWDKKSQGAQSLVAQANRRLNPELGFEIEEFGGGLRGFSESEWTLSLSQEIELWGKRRARKSEAVISAQIVDFEADVARFDIFSKTKERYFSTALAQSRFDLTKIELRAANEMVDAVRVRVENGAALVTDLHLAELELDRSKISLKEAEANWVISKKFLISLWTSYGDEVETFYVKLYEPPQALPSLSSLLELVDGERELVRLSLEVKEIDAKSQSEKSESRPNLTVSAGIKRIRVDDINTFLVGVSFPLPLFDRRQNQMRALDFDRQATELKQSQMKSELTAQIKTMYEELLLSKSRLKTLSTDIVPRAQATYESIGDAFGKGRVPYTAMLEGKRLLIDLETERSETKFEFWQKLIELEKMLGIRLVNLSIK